MRYCVGICFLMFWNCHASSSHAQDVLTIAARPPSNPNLFLFRDHAEPLIFSTTVKIDGQKVGSIGQKRFLAVYATPGKHVISINWPFMSGQKKSEISIDINNTDQAHYFEIVGVSRVTGFVGNTYMIRMGSGIGEVDPIQGEIKMKYCCKSAETKVVPLN